MTAVSSFSSRSMSPIEDGTVEMRAGDYLNIPARRRHRVEWTAPDGPTVWLAVFYRGGPPAAASTPGG